MYLAGSASIPHQQLPPPGKAAGARRRRRSVGRLRRRITRRPVAERQSCGHRVVPGVSARSTACAVGGMRLGALRRRRPERIRVIPDGCVDLFVSSAGPMSMIAGPRHHLLRPARGRRRMCVRGSALAAGRGGRRRRGGPSVSSRDHARSPSVRSSAPAPAGWPKRYSPQRLPLGARRRCSGR